MFSLIVKKHQYKYSDYIIIIIIFKYRQRKWKRFKNKSI